MPPDELDDDDDDGSGYDDADDGCPSAGVLLFPCGPSGWRYGGVCV